MPHIRKVSVDEAKGKLASIYEAARARAGGVAEIIQVMSLDANIVQASMAFYMAVMKRDNALSGARRELLASVVSNVNDCYY